MERTIQRLKLAGLHHSVDLNEGEPVLSIRGRPSVDRPELGLYMHVGEIATGIAGLNLTSGQHRWVRHLFQGVTARHTVLALISELERLGIDAEHYRLSEAKHDITLITAKVGVPHNFPDFHYVALRARNEKGERFILDFLKKLKQANVPHLSKKESEEAVKKDADASLHQHERVSGVSP